ncbi:MAG: 4Fe-4S dicluster domain-containing protein [Thermoplasmatales archaeon]|nr:4Fe-4S dicluster domain-containing protein [Thermoplasmatales archaeon]
MIDSNDLDPNFKYEVAAEIGGANINRCFACGTCTAGCPVREIDEKYNPRKIIRMVLLGMRERVLKSDFIWLCSTCYTCYDRCPQDVQLTSIMTALKNIAAREGYIHPSFKEQARLVSKFGRLYEIEDFDNKKREKLGLPPIKKNFDDITKITKDTLPKGVIQ